MTLIGLPGQNPETAGWMQSLLDDLALGQTTENIARYRHWDDGSRPDVAHEAQQLHIESGDTVIAKSMGTMVLLGHAESGQRPDRAVFIGTPIRGYPPESIESLQAFAEAVPSLFIQQTDDVTGGFEALKAVVGECARASLAEIVGDDHVYADTAELKAIIEEWWNMSD
jgi:hypothetical protein